MTELLKISELAARAGVEKSTVAHYRREGLLPPPVEKPHRNVAYYSADLVERIRIIKDLQAKRYLPLAKIKQLLDDPAGIEEIASFLGEQPLAIPELSKDELVTESGLTPAELADLETAGFIRAADARGRFRPADAAVIRAVASMQQAGLNEANGFTLTDMTMYMDAMRQLIGREVAMFSRIMGALPREQVLEMARVGLDGTNLLLVALRRKVFLDLLGDMVAGEAGG